MKGGSKGMMRWKLKSLIAECAEVMGERLTYRQIEADLGISKTTLTHIAQNKTTRTDFGTLNSLLNYLSAKLERPLTTSDLLEFVPDSNAVQVCDLNHNTR